MVRGYIDYREWEESPKSINFKISLNDKKGLNFSPAAVRSFSISGLETYISYAGKISMDKTRFPDLPNGLDTSAKQETIFLQQLSTGKYLTLYYNGDAIKKRYFIAEKDSMPVELVHHQYYNDDREIVNSFVYRGQLLLYINKYRHDNSKLISEANNLNYEQVYLVQFVNHLNDERVIKTKSSRLYAGISLNATQTVENDFQYNGSNKSNTTYSPKIHFGIDLFNNSNVQQLIFRTDISLSYINPKYYFPVTVSSVATNQVYEFTQYAAAITPQILLNLYNKDKFKFYIDMGIGCNFSAYSNNEFTIQNENVQNTSALTTKNPYSLANFWTNFPAQAGIVLNKKVEIFVSYAFATKYTENSDFYVSSQSTNIGFRYLLK